ncbi:asparagine synthase (glutamine-hydrolyzing) [Salipaludibacillus keqinensis]|uniref:asparagine synthase (glutamine-hydrolyzing) n=1 Tax=Salipaludibacillus keqinensis TaxID=2045207 RepID=A0A323THU2_9BACI|nr:asparagine synthase (glutamine-hydrolyzing) [Salipaludibacillus keqinensis]PYZ94408.1 asparagine synthase (glutamine-hydrolyzing) [Salipaludibacillus keqinensis]
MCGITGWVDFDHPINEHHLAVVNNMANTLTHRGPDRTTTWTSDHVVFGHTRLIVVDPSGGSQPMTRSINDKSFTICYNGELYNTEDLRKELLQFGYTFRSHSDTEVLLTAYIHWQDKCLDKLNGIFSFAIWDEGRKQLFLARDRLGVKPLFIYPLRNGWLFGSELKAILAHPEVRAEVKEQGLQELLGLSPSRTPGHGVFNGMEELKPGHWMKASSKKAEIQRYWQVKSLAHRESVEETAQHVRDLLKDAVQRQLVADVPVCTFLSGGLDSSAITAFASDYFKEHGKPPLKTFSVDYEENDQYFKANDFQPNSDAPWVNKVSQTFKTNHHRSVISQKELYRSLKEAMRARDLPGMADIDSSLLWFCGTVRNQVTVGLSGECADEIFGGYPWFHNEEKLNGDTFPWMNSVSEREKLLQPKWRKKLELVDYVRHRYEDTLREVPLLQGETGIEAKRRKMFYVNMIWFMTTLLERKDRMSMGKSLEVRVPFADHRLVEYVWNIPWEMKMLDGREKGILRKALEGVLPSEVLYRKKSPYPKTHHPTYKNLVTSALKQLVDIKDSPLFDIFEYNQIQQLAASGGDSFQTPYFGQLMSGPQLIAHLLQMDMWLKDYNVKIIT